MKVGQIIGNIPDIAKTGIAQKTNKADFGDFLTNVIKDVNQTQINSEKITEDFALGKDIEIHDVMIAEEKAKTSLQLLMEIRNKTIDMYKELTKMPG